MKQLLLSAALLLSIATTTLAETPAVKAVSTATPLVIGETFTVDSKILGETRRINVYLPPGYAESPGSRLPVLYMPDGGIAEDFLHVAGLVQVSVGNGTMRPFLLVGIQWHYEKMPEEKHSTIYHPAALRAFRAVFKPGMSK